MAFRIAAIPKNVIERFSKEPEEFQRIRKNAKNRDLNEADTVDIVNDILGSVFEFDKYTETTREFAIRGTYCDLAVTIDGKYNIGRQVYFEESNDVKAAITRENKSGGGFGKGKSG